jgi:hypothetical protein
MQNNSQQDLQAGRRDGYRKAKSRDFHQTAENECQDIVEGSAPSETEKETAHKVRAGGVGALTTLGTSVRTDGRTMMVIKLDRLAPYQAARHSTRSGAR